MNRQVLGRNSKPLKGGSQSEDGWRTDDDLRQIGGDQEELVGLWMDLYGFTRERAAGELDRFMLEDQG